MKPTQTKLRCRIIKMERLTNTPDGNPRWLFITTHGNYRTADNASVNYEISESALDRRVVVFTLERNRIVDVELTRQPSSCEICGRNDGLHDEEECFK